jgi:prephenate dehydrogenase
MHSATLGIIGTGLIGGSIGMRAREQGWHVIGFDIDTHAEEAVRCGAVDDVAPLESIHERADTIVVAAHISATLEHIERMRSAPPANARLILDIASVKAPIVRSAHGLRNFVATHPMAGRERSGPSAAVRDLFEGKTWLYVPTGDAELDARAVDFITAFDAMPVAVDAEEHDRIVALTSHLPQIFATLFAQRLSLHTRHGEPVEPRVTRHAEPVEPHVEAFMGPTARELMRLSRSSPAMWSGILEANHEYIERELRALAGDLTAVADGLAHGENLYRQEPARQ